MASRKENYYEVLGVAPDASQREIDRAWRKLDAQLQDERTAPDPRRQMLAQEAHDTLSDPQRRAAYDEMLRGPTLLGIRGGRDPRKRWTVAIGSVFIALGLAYYFLVARQPVVDNLYPATDGALEVHTKATVAIGRVSRIDMSGKAAQLGVAVAVQEGVMMTPCGGIAPGAQIVVTIPPRAAPGQVLHADESLGLCMLRMHAGASYPLLVTAQEPRPSQRIFAVQLNAQGEVALREAKVERVLPTPAGKVVEVARPLATVPDGTPLLDLDGRVFAIAIDGHYRMLTAGWVQRAQADTVPPPAAKPREEEPEPKAAPQGRRVPMRPEDIPPERRERLEKAFRPPPTVPDDI
jgi:hypothetical protein